MTDDWAAINALICAYAERLDAGDFAGVAELFAEATLRTDGQPGAARGREEVHALYAATVKLYGGRPCTRHVTTNLVIEVDPAGGTAAARSYFTVFQARPELPLQAIIAGRYRDRFTRRDGVWRFAERVICIELVGDLRFHLQDHILALLGPEPVG
jgi:3-phenylpropionate/cinnamic acid dioxygenase small subunit